MPSSALHVKKKVPRPLRRPVAEFVDRFDAGRQLATFVAAPPDSRSMVLALPRGGVPVAEPLAQALGSRLDVIVTRKLPVPDSPEQGFGAVTSDGSMVLNERYLAYLRLSEQEIDAIAQRVQREVRRRERTYRSSAGPIDVQGLTVYLVDDGLATGYTAMAAAKMIREMAPRSLKLAVPCSPVDSLETVRPYFDELFCLVAQESGPFAVASSYYDFHDLSDNEVLEILHRTGKTAA
jgi:putative phosphoribosyl transferase